MAQNIKLYKAANDIVIEVGPGRKILPTTDSDINIVVDRPVLRFNLTSEHLTAREGTASNEIEIASATGQVVLKDIDHARLRRSNGNTWGSTRAAVISALNGSTLFGATLIDTRITTNANDISDVESDISTIQGDISDIESDVLNLAKALKFSSDDRGVFLDDSKNLNSSYLRIQPAENKLQTGTTGNTFYSSTESSPGEHTFAVQAGASGNETSITSLTIAGSSTAAKSTATFGSSTAVSLGSTLSVTGNTVLRNLSFSSTGSPHTVSFSNASVTNLTASSISSGTFANARISSSSVLQHADNYGSWNLKTGGVQRTTVGSGGDLNLVGGTGISLAYSAGGTVTITSSASSFDGAFSSLTGTPTTIAGYGITDALELGTTSTTALAGDTTTITTAQANAITANTAKTSFPGFGTTAGTALEGDTSLFSGAFGDLTGKPTTISGYGITDAFDGSAASLTGTLNMARIADDAITGAKIAHNTLDAIHINASAIGASELNVAGNGTSGQLLASDGDGTFSWVNAVSDTNTNIANADLTLDSDHLVTLDGNELTFRSSSSQYQETLVIADDGMVTVGAGSGLDGATLALREAGGNGAQYVGLQAPDSLSASVTFTLPSADGSNGQVLSTNGSGALSFTTISDTNTNIGNTDFTLSANRKIIVDGYDFSLNSSTYSPLFLWDDSLEVFEFRKPVIFTNTNGYTSGEIRLKEYPVSGDGDYVGFKAPGSISGNCLWTLPSADGTNGQVLTTNGSKVLSWTNPTVTTVKFFYSGGAQLAYPYSRYLPLTGDVVEQNTAGSALSRTGFIAPYDGSVKKIIARSEETLGNTVLQWYKATDGTHAPATSLQSVTVNIDTANTSETYTYTSVTFSKGDILSLRIDPTSDPVSTTMEFNYIIEFEFDTST